MKSLGYERKKIITKATTKMLYILSKLFKSAEHWFNSTAPACVSGNNFKLLLATIEQFN